MPTYEYSCNDCGERLEIVQSIHDDSLTECPKCHGKLRKHFGNVGVVFKGSGFYKTDSRSSNTSTTSSKPSSTATTDSSSGAGASTSDASSAAPAKTTDTSSSTSTSSSSSTSD